MAQRLFCWATAGARVNAPRANFVHSAAARRQNCYLPRKPEPPKDWPRNSPRKHAASGYDADFLELGSLSLEASGKARARIDHRQHARGWRCARLRRPICAAAAGGARNSSRPGSGTRCWRSETAAYSKFCSFGQHIDERFAALGAIRLTARIEADGDVEGPFKSFRDTLWRTLPAAKPRKFGSEPVLSAVETSDEGAPEPNEPQLVAASGRLLPACWGSTHSAAPASDKETRHIVLSLKDADLHYEPGDALGVWPRQAPTAGRCGAGTERLLRRMQPVTIDGEQMVLRERSSRKRELTTLAATTVINYAALASDNSLQFLVAARQKRRAQTTFSTARTIVDLLQEFPGTIRDAQSLVDLLPPLKPRLYSISSSLAAFPRGSAFNGRSGSLRMRRPTPRRPGLHLDCRSGGSRRRRRHLRASKSSLSFAIRSGHTDHHDRSWDRYRAVSRLPSSPQEARLHGTHVAILW